MSLKHISVFSDRTTFDHFAKHSYNMLWGIEEVLMRRWHMRVIVDIMGIEDINVDWVPPLGMTLHVQNDTVTLTDENIIVSNGDANAEEAGNDNEVE